jgi:type II pantothenate kinase
MMTGVGSSYITHGLYGLNCVRVPEFRAIGIGGLYLSGLEEALCVSMGTGTALVHAKAGGTMNYIGGTGVGGGSLVGLAKLLVGAENIEHIAELAEGGDLSNVDLRIKDITSPDALEALSRDLTASNFGNLSDMASKSDIATGVLNMVFETVAMVSVFAARSVGVRDIVLTGNVTQLDYCRRKFEELNGMGYGVRFIIPEQAQFATVIGAALCEGTV